jgi:hypothetical protein
MAQSQVLEYDIVEHEWEWYIRQVNTDEKKRDNYRMNMDAFLEIVNDMLAEGWEPLGAPIFNSQWSIGKSGRVSQTIIRKKNVERAVLAESSLAIMAELVKPLRSSLRAKVVTGN